MRTTRNTYRTLAIAAVLAALCVSYDHSGTTVSAQSNPRSTPLRASALSTTVVTLSGSAVTLDLVACENPSNAAAFLQVFNVAGGTAVALGTTLPTQSFSIPTLQGLTISPPLNEFFSNGVKIAATTSATGSSAPSAAIDCNFSVR